MTTNDQLPAIESRLTADEAEYGPGMADQSIRDRRALLGLVREQQARIDTALEGHVPNDGHNPSCDCGIAPGANQRCCGCYEGWPCPTITALTAMEGA